MVRIGRGPSAELPWSVDEEMSWIDQAFGEPSFKLQLRASCLQPFPSNMRVSSSISACNSSLTTNYLCASTQNLG